MTEEAYTPVPVQAARDIAELYDKDVVVVTAIDRRFGQTHTTTYGKTPQDKAYAAHAGPVLATAIGGEVLKKRVFEDFRTLQAAEGRWAIELLESLVGLINLSARQADPIVRAKVEEAVKFLKTRSCPPSSGEG